MEPQAGQVTPCLGLPHSGQKFSSLPHWSQKYISRAHGQFRLLDGQWQVMDLNSHNGTFLNGQRLVINTWYDLNIGDQLRIATTDFIVQ